MSWTPLDIKISVLFYFVFTITHDQGLNALITSSLVLFLPGFFLAMNYCIPLQWTVLNALYIIQRRKGLKKLAQICLRTTASAFLLSSHTFEKKILKNDPLIVASLETAPGSWIVRPVVHESVLACLGDSSQTIFSPSWGLRPEWKFEKVAECNSDQLMRDLAPATSGHCRGSFSWPDWGPGRLVVNASINVARAKAGVANAAAFVTQFSL